VTIVWEARRNEVAAMPFMRGFGLRGYRSFHSGMQFLAPMEQVTLVAGQNNAGKSNIIRFASQVLGSVRGCTGLTVPLPELDSLDTPTKAADRRSGIVEPRSYIQGYCQ
jgi:hypothetical protein